MTPKCFANAALAVLLVCPFASVLSYPAIADPPAGSLEQRLNQHVLDWYPSDAEPGAAVLVTVDGRPVLKKGYGLADQETGAKITPDTVFRIASVTKQFTAVAVLQLVQQGRISLDDPLSKYVPEFNTHGKTVTIEHLLSHTSGIPSYTATEGYFDGMSRDMTPAGILALVADKPLDFEPGSRFDYSNTNYVLLGMIIEKASGQTYAEYIESHIARPLGLASTRYSRGDAESPRHARGYERDDSGKWVRARPLSMTQPYAAGAIESTVADLAKWTQALTDGKAVDPKLLERAWTPLKPADSPSEYGYGWFIRTDAGERWIGHNGGINGFQSSAVWIPEKKVFVAILRNAMGGPAPHMLLKQLALEAVGRPAAKRVAIQLPESTLERYVGVYALSPEIKFTFTRDGPRLFVEAPGKPKMEVFAEAEDKFFSKEVDAQFSFVVENGKATQMNFHRPGRELPAKREE
jgi:CubicO group peptidase (beta-lactamase class C family)